MLDTLNTLDLVFGGLFLFFAFRLLSNRRHGLFPPGPKGLPFIGNILDMPPSHEWLRFAEWGNRWGGIVSVTLLGQTIVILNSVEFAEELLVKRSSLYSDRPTLVMGGELVGYKKTLALTRYGGRFREYRRFIFRILGTRSHVQQYHALAEKETHRFVRRLLSEPETLVAHIRKTAGAIILKISHGYTVKDGEDPIVNLVDTATEQFSDVSRAGAFLVDVLPLLRFVPSWIPGAGFKKKVAPWAKTLDEMADIPHNFVKHQMEIGADIPNYTSHLLQSEELTPEKEFNIKWSAASLYSGGADTTVSAIYSFFLAVTLYPEVQRRAQEEIDRVVGNNRLPGFEDRENLPYVEALVQEVFRFHPVAPLAIPHRLTEDDEYRGYHLPKGSLIIPNIWKFLHDPKIYPNPSVFDPTRFLSSDSGRSPQRDPREIVFGFGRRICPGLNLADASVFISCAMSLAVFDISKSVENGQVVEPVHGFTSGVISHPLPFKCTMKPRSAKAEALILAAEEVR